MSDLLETLRLAADDPMWANHAEVPKKLLRHTVDRIEYLEREVAENKRRNAELEREIDGLRNSYWEERKAHLAAEADKARLSEALRPFAAITEVPALGSITVDMVRDARAALSGSGSGWRE